MKRLRMMGLAGIAVTLILAATWLIAPRDGPAVESRLVVAAEPAPSSEGFARASGPIALNFPADHGPHPDYQTEWWYITGNLATSEGHRFGYQLTFFRRALVPPSLRQPRTSSWAADQVYMAHLALTDVADRHYQAFERLARGSAGLAGAQAEPLAVWLENWTFRESAPNTYQLLATQDDLSLDLRLVALKAPVLHGQAGYSQKGPDPGNASFYSSLTRLETSGTVQLGPARYPVIGLSWMDHEYSTSALSADQVGWDWFSLQLDDDSELMVFQIRRTDGTIDPYSSGTLVAADGSSRHLESTDFEILVTDQWRSPQTGASYPSRWMLQVPSAGLSLELVPLLADQELNVSYAYWEGAVKAEGGRAGSAVGGHGYVEMTGYAASMQGQF